jgi:glycosyltransferase involved in cell wall biosynthesis
MDTTPPFVSVIIPVFNDGERLKICLQSLENQTYPQSLYEVIVVDNASEEDIKSIVSSFGQAQYTFESRPGSYAARNKGISLAKGEILAFTDSDCIPAANWIEQGVGKMLQTPNLGMVAGRIELFFKTPGKPTAIELYDALVLGGLPQQLYIESEKYGATANVFTFKQVIEHVGGFDAGLKSNGDFEWGQRVFTAGYRQIYAEDVCVAHPSRSTLNQLYKKTIRLVGGKMDLKAKQGYAINDFLKDFLKDFLPPFRFVFSTFSRSELQVDRKIKLVLIRLYLKQVSAWERARLQLGGTSARG